MITSANVPRVSLEKTAKQVRYGKLFERFIILLVGDTKRRYNETTSLVMFVIGLSEIKECDSQPCQNGAKCVEGDENIAERSIDLPDEESSYVCVCVPGYTGRNCEKGMFIIW